MKEYLIMRRHKVKASAHFNAPLVEAWSVVGRFMAEDEQDAIERAVNATGCDAADLKVYGSVTRA